MSWFSHNVPNIPSYANKNLPIILDVDSKHNELKSISLEKKKKERKRNEAQLTKLEILLMPFSALKKLRARHCQEIRSFYLSIL